MEDTVAFVNPARLLVDEVEKIATGLEAELFADGLFSDGIQRAGAGRIDEGEFIGDLNLRGDRRNTEGDPEFNRDFGVDFDEVAPGGETFGGKIEAIDAEGQVLKDEMPVRGNLEAALEVVAFAEKFALGSKAGAFWVADFEMKFAAEALGAGGHGRHEAEEADQEREPA